MGYFGWHAWLWLMRNEPLDRAAEKVVLAALAGDGGTVSRYALRREHETFRIGNQGYQDFVHGFVAPRVSGGRRGETLQEWDGERSALHYTVLLANAAGAEIPLTVTLHKTPDGPRGYLLGDLALAAVLLQHARPEGSRPLDYFAAAEQAVRKEAPELRRYGVHSLLSGGPEAQPVPWEQMADYWRVSLERRAAMRKAQEGS